MSREVQKIYSGIYKDYDRLGAIFSLGTMGRWRNIAANEAMSGKKRHMILDVATGTGELAFDMAEIADKDGIEIDITGVDFNSDMLKVAKKKAQGRIVPIKFELGDALKLKYPNNSFDIVTSGFGLKNLDSLQRFSDEVRRVLKKDGKFVFVDIAKSDSAVGRLFIGAYWNAIGKLCKMAGRDAYIPLINSINDFNKPKFVKILKATGFKDVKIRKLSFGPAFLITGKK